MMYIMSKQYSICYINVCYEKNKPLLFAGHILFFGSMVKGVGSLRAPPITKSKCNYDKRALPSIQKYQFNYNLRALAYALGLELKKV